MVGFKKGHIVIYCYVMIKLEAMKVYLWENGGGASYILSFDTRWE
jgi:hypothetical protein